MKEAISYYAANREELQVLVEEKVLAAKVLCESVSDNVNTIAEKVDEFKDLPSTIQGMIEDTKTAFTLPHKGEGRFRRNCMEKKKQHCIILLDL